MEQTLLNLICLLVIVTVIVDISDFPSTVKKIISYIITKGKIIKDDYRIHLVDCSFCIFWWCGIIYLLIVGEFTLPYVTVVLFMACLSEVTKSAILLVKDIFVTIINLIYKLIDR